MDRRLRDEAIRRGDTKEAREERCQAEKCKIVMESGRLAQRKLGSLRDQRLGDAK